MSSGQTPLELLLLVVGAILSAGIVIILINNTIQEPDPDWVGEWQCDEYLDNVCDSLQNQSVCFVKDNSILSKFVEGSEPVDCKTFCSDKTLDTYSGNKVCVSRVWVERKEVSG